jgi:hypothetical protein
MLAEPDWSAQRPSLYNAKPGSNNISHRYDSARRGLTLRNRPLNRGRRRPILNLQIEP